MTGKTGKKYINKKDIFKNRSVEKEKKKSTKKYWKKRQRKSGIKKKQTERRERESESRNELVGYITRKPTIS